VFIISVLQIYHSSISVNMAPQNLGNPDNPPPKKRRVEVKFQAAPNSSTSPMEIADDDDLTFTKRGTEPYVFK